MLLVPTPMSPVSVPEVALVRGAVVKGKVKVLTIRAGDNECEQDLELPGK